MFQLYHHLKQQINKWFCKLKKWYKWHTKINKARYQKVKDRRNVNRYLLHRNTTS